MLDVHARASASGPEPLAWLRARGKPLATAAEREAVLEAAYKMVAENIDAVSAAQEQDRVFPSRFNGVAQNLMAGAKNYQGLVRAWMEPEALEDACPSMLKAGTEAEWTVINEPKGVCINISPWNAPFQLSVIPMLAMLATGNHVVIKPPDLVTHVSALLRRLVQKYLHGYVWVEEGGPETVERIIDEAADHLVFIGGCEIAKIVAARCATVLTPVTLELGGKSPVFIDRGLSEEMLACAVREILQTKVEKTGQFCCAHDYALVHQDAHAAFCAKIGAELEALGERRNIHLVGRRQYLGLKQKLEEALAGGAECIPAMAGSFVPNDEAMTLPMTCLLEAPADSSLLQTEIFGPLLPILKVKDVGAAIDMVNVPSRRKPLIAYCYTEDPAAVDAFIAKTSSGNIAVNSGPQRMISNFHCAFGGIGPSGTGHAMWGKEAMKEFSNQKYVIRAKDGFAKSFFSGPPPAAS